MKVLFLDVDGVLNRAGTKERVERHGVLGVESGKCDLIRKILRETGAQIVEEMKFRTG